MTHELQVSARAERQARAPHRAPPSRRRVVGPYIPILPLRDERAGRVANSGRRASMLPMAQTTGVDRGV